MNTQQQALIAALFFGISSALSIMVASPLFASLDLDSQSYLNFAPSRTAIYPLFLSLFSGLSYQIEITLILQGALYSLSLGYLIYTLQMTMRSWFITILFGLGVAGNIYLQAFNSVILTESLTFTLMHLLIAFVLKASYQPEAQSYRTTIFIGVLGGLLAALKPAMITILPALTIVIVLIAYRHHQRMGRQLGICGLAFIAPLLVESAVYYQAHEARVSLLPVTLFGKAAILTTDPHFQIPSTLTGKEAAILQATDDLFAPYQSWLATETNPLVTSNITGNIEVFGQWETLPLLEDRNGLTRPSDDQLATIGQAVITNHKMSYIRLSLGYLGELWAVQSLAFSHKLFGSILPIFEDTPLNNALPTFTAKGGPLDPESGHFANWLSVIIFPAFALLGLASLIGGLVSILAILTGLNKSCKRPSADVVVLAALHLIGWSNLVFIALVNIPTPRYLMPHFAGFVLAALIGITLLMRVLKTHRSDKVQNSHT